MLSSYADHVELPVSDEQDRSVRGEVVRALKQIHTGLQHGPTAAAHLHVARACHLVFGGGFRYRWLLARVRPVS